MESESPFSLRVVFTAAETGPAPDHFDLRFRLEGALDWIDREDVESPYLLPDLLVYSRYEVQLRAYIEDAYSDWGVIGIGRTALPPRPERMGPPSFLLLCNNTIIVSFVPLESLRVDLTYDLRYQEEGENEGWQLLQTITRPHLIANLNPGSRYLFQIRAVNVGGAGRWSPIELFDIAEPLNVADHLDLLIGQYDEPPRLRALIEGLLQLHQRELVEQLCRLENFSLVDLAEGVWLDRIGQRLGLYRPTDRSYRFLGFGRGEDRGTFGEVPFHSTAGEISRSGISDPWYRSLLKGQGIRLRSGCSITDIEAVCAVVFTGGGWVEEDAAAGSITVTVVDFRAGFIPIAEASGVIPKPAGVAMTIVEGEA